MGHLDPLSQVIQGSLLLVDGQFSVRSRPTLHLTKKSHLEVQYRRIVNVIKKVDYQQSEVLMSLSKSHDLVKIADVLMAPR